MVVRYANDLISLSMNITGNLRNKRKIIKNLGVYLQNCQYPISKARLLNVEFEWDPEHLSDEPSLEGRSIPITILMVKKVISKMKFSKAHQG